MAWHSELGRAGRLQSIAVGGESIRSEAAAAVTHLTQNKYLVEAPG